MISVRTSTTAAMASLGMFAFSYASADIADGEAALSPAEVSKLFQCGENTKKSKKKPTLTYAGETLSEQSCSCAYEAISVDTGHQNFISEVQGSSDGLLYAYDLKMKDLAKNPWRSLVVISALKKVELIENVNSRVNLESELSGTALSRHCDLKYMPLRLEDSK